jgi:hypothetical protein
MNVLRADEAKVGVLNDVLRIAAAAEHAIAKPQQPPAVGRYRIAFMRPA